MPKKHSYLATHTISAPVLAFSLSGEDAGLRAKAAGAKSGRAATTLVKAGRMRITLIAMTKGTVLSAHQVEGAVSIQSIRGKVRVSAEGSSTELATGGLFVLQEEVPHAAVALSDCALLVTVAM
jgi:quercetin dioxygenase-like cupin family protein